jgi:hypothetical protein
MDWVKRLSVGQKVGEPLEDHVVLGLNQVGWGTFDVRSDEFPGVKVKDTCRFYVGRTDKFTVLLLQGRISIVEEPRPGVTRFTVHQRCRALEKDCALSLPNCTALHVLQELVEATGLTFATADPKDSTAGYLTKTVAEFKSQGTLRGALDSMGAAFGVPDAFWYEQPDGKVFWGSWSQTAMAKTPLPLHGNVIQERDPKGQSVFIPIVGAIRPGMVMQAPEGRYRVEELQLQGDRMRLAWTEAQA